MKKSSTNTAAFLLVFIIAAGILGYIGTEGLRLNYSSKSYVDRIIPQIAASWDATTALADIDQQKMMDQHIPMPAIILIMMRDSQRFGPMKSYEGSEGSATVTGTGDKKVITARYTAKLECQYGPAVFEVELIKHPNDWKIARFYVRSPDEKPRMQKKGQ